MATKREQIVVDIGGDAKLLMKEFDISKNAAQKWVREVAKSITQGEMPEAWKKFAWESKNLATLNEKNAEATHKSWKKWGGETGKEIAKIGKAFVAAFAVNQVVRSLQEVSKELGDLDAQLNSSAYLKLQRQNQLANLSNSDKENILAGNAQMESASGGIKNKLGVAAGLFAFGGGAVSENFKEFGRTMNPATLLFGWGQASVKAAEAQKEIVLGIKIASAQAAADEENKKKAVESEKRLAQEQKARQDFNELRTKNFAEYEEKMRKRNTEMMKQQNELLEKQSKLKQMIATARSDYSGKLGQNIHDEFLPTLDELATTGRYTAEAKRLQFLQSDTKDAILWNDQSSMTRNIDEIQSIRDKLTKAGVFKDPNQALINEFKMLTDPIRATGKLPVQVELDK